jgi:hypothetical protein
MNLMYLLRPMIADPAGISYFQSVETELGRVSHIARQTLDYYREQAAASSAAIGDIVLPAITIYEPRCTATGIEIKIAINSSRKIVLRRGDDDAGGLKPEFVAKQFVEGHRDRIEIESRQNGEDPGTTVRVFLSVSTTYDPSGDGAAAKD